jgi:hypothetical protein
MHARIATVVLGKPSLDTYSPIIPRLKAFFKNREMIKLMGYRANYIISEESVKTALSRISSMEDS